MAEGGPVAGGHQISVAHHADPVGDREHFFEPVGDVEDQQAARAERRDHLEQLALLRQRQYRRRLVEDEDAGCRRQSAGQLDQLAVGDTQRTHQRLGRQIDAETLQQGARFNHSPFAVDQSAASGEFAAEEDIVRDRDFADRDEFLIDDADAFSRAMAGDSSSTLSPASRNSPELGKRAPAKMFISVDLPAPLAPTIA